jgi:hypothetical protein
MFRVSRSGRSDDHTRDARVALFVAGATAALAGIAFDIGWLVTVAIALLACGMLLGILERRRADADE